MARSYCTRETPTSCVSNYNLNFANVGTQTAVKIISIINDHCEE